MERKLKVLHITPDEKFFDRVFAAWEKNESFENKAIFITNNSQYCFKYIESTQKIEILYNDKMVNNYLSTEKYDIVFFHSMPLYNYKYVKKIPKDRILIWWGWGYDIYNGRIGLPPLLKLNLYKPLTQKFVKASAWSLQKLLYSIKLLFESPLMRMRRRYVLKRIDYFQPVLKIEYEMMCKLTGFRAKEFYYNKSFANITYDIIQQKSSDGNILLGNSATTTNNHADILLSIKEKKQEKQSIIMPLSYPKDSLYTEWLNNYVKDDNIIAIKDFMPISEYFKLLDSCSYAVFGVIRQQGIGNINYALRRGIKVFLYKDSIVYKNFKDLGFIVYAIEDITEESFSTPLSRDEIEQNLKAAQRERLRRLSVYEDFYKEISNHV